MDTPIFAPQPGAPVTAPDDDTRCVRELGADAALLDRDGLTLYAARRRGASGGASVWTYEVLTPGSADQLRTLESVTEDDIAQRRSLAPITVVIAGGTGHIAAAETVNDRRRLDTVIDALA